MVFIASFLVLAASLSASATPLKRATVSTLVDDLNTLTARVQTADEAILALPQEGANGVNDFIIALSNVEGHINQVSNDAASVGSLSSEDGETLIGVTQTTGDAFIQALNDLVSVQATVSALGEESDAHAEVFNWAQEISSYFANFISSLNGFAQQNAAETIENNVENAFAAAFAAFP